MVSAMDFKKYERGSLLGFFTLRYHGLSIQNCRLMAGSNGAWFAFPQDKRDKDGETEYIDILHLTNPEREHVRSLILADLQQQGHIQLDKSHMKASTGNGQYQTPEGEDLSEYHTNQGQDDIPF